MFIDHAKIFIKAGDGGNGCTSFYTEKYIANGGPDGGDGGGEEKEDPLFLDAIGVAFEFETMSTSLLQRRLSVGYSRAQKMIDMMEARGYVGKFDTQTKKRKIVITFEEYQQLRLNKESAE